MGTTRTSPTYTYAGLSFHFEITWTDAENSIRYKCKVVPTTSGKEFNTEVRQGLKLMTASGRALVDVEGTRVTQTKPCSWAERTVQTTDAVIVQMYAGDISWEDTYSTAVKVPTPLKCEARKINNGKYEIVVTGQGSTKYPASQVHIERSDNGGSYSELTGSPIIPSNMTGSYTITFTDQTTTTDTKYVWRAYVSNAYGNSGYSYSNGQHTSPTTASSIEVKEVGNIRVLQWEVDDVGSINLKNLSGWVVLVEENRSGIWLPIGIVPAVPLIYKYTWIHIPIAGTSTRYRLQAFGEGGLGTSGSATDSWTAPPTKPQGAEAYRTPEVNVVINITDRSNNTAEEVHIERNIDGEGWEEISVQTFPCSQYLDTTVIGNSSVEYRIRNANSKGFSDYVQTGVVPLLSKPNAPSLISPYDNSIGIIDDNSLTFVFQHNPTDGTPQVEAELRYRTDGEWTTISLQDEPSYTIDLLQFSVNDVIEWQARTHGNYNEDGVWVWSDWSVVYSITLLRKPQITITSPQNTSSISTLPIVLGYMYTDDSGTLADLTIEIVKDEVEATYKPNVGDGTTGTYSYPLTDFLFDNNENYEIVVSALSSTGLATEDRISIYIDYAETSDEGALIPTFIGDQETGIVNIQLTQDMTEDVEIKNIVEAYIYRNHEGVRTLVGSALQGELIEDKYAPLNVTYSYEFLMLTDESEVILTRYDYELDSSYSFIYYGNEIFRAKWNPEFDVSFDRPERVEKRYSGREYPVSYDSMAIDEACGYSTVLTEREDVVKLKTMMRKGNGQGIWKSADGDSYLANFSVSYQTNRYYKKQVWRVSLNVKRIDNGNSNR